jgi:hypothetical protein
VTDEEGPFALVTSNCNVSWNDTTQIGVLRCLQQAPTLSARYPTLTYNICPLSSLECGLVEPQLYYGSEDGGNAATQRLTMLLAAVVGSSKRAYLEKALPMSNNFAVNL